MATIEQFTELTRYAETLPEQERLSLSVDEIYDRWRAETLNEEDLAAVEESLADYRSGERGRSAAESMTDLRRKINAKFSG